MIAPARLARALDYAGTHTAADIAEAVQQGRFQQWDGELSTIITEIQETPLRKTLLFFLAEGEGREIAAMAGPIMVWAKMQGCTHASLVGRFGWERCYAPQLGFQKTAVVMEREL
jgi:hypothetical protein